MRPASLFSTVCTALILATSGTTHANIAQTTADDEKRFKRADITEDGWLSGTELQSGWLKYDTDGNKEVTRAEFLTGRAKERGAAGPKPAPAAPPPAAGTGTGTGPTLTLPGGPQAVAGKKVAIRYAGGPGGYMDSIELYKPQRGGGGRGTLVSSAFVWGAKEGKVELPAHEPGQYEVRYVTQTTSKVLQRVALRVVAASFAPPAARPGAVRATIPAGVYETYFFGYDFALSKWLAGDITIGTGGSYQFQNKTGRCYRDPASGRVVWESGPLKGVYALYRPEKDGNPCIVIPKKENKAAGRELAATDISAYRKRK